MTAAGAKMLVVEDLVCGPNIECSAKIGDVNMLARTGVGTALNANTATC
jgi:hypothetical protein